MSNEADRPTPKGRQLATPAQLKALLDSYADGDSSLFLSVASQIAAQSSRVGARKLASELQSAIRKAKSVSDFVPPSRSPVIPISQGAGELAGLISASYPDIRLSDMILSEDVESRLRRVIREFQHAGELEAHGLMPRRKLLLVGPPGCGKSMTAAAIAGELGRPLLQVQLHALIAKYLGETAAKLHLVFRAMVNAPGVYLFDEFDALGAHRTGANDVGEARRILNSFLVFLEQDRSPSLIIAATNTPQTLDEALFRRFDDVIEYQAPSTRLLRPLIRAQLSAFGASKLRWPEVLKAAQGLSQADAVRACEDAAKEAVLDGTHQVRTSVLTSALRARQRTRE